MIRNILFASIFAVLFFSGCTSLFEGTPAKQYVCPDGSTVVSELSDCPEPEKHYLCPDGLTVVGDMADCPKVDTELKECEEASDEGYYGASDRDVCYYELAIYRENASLCRKIRNTDDWYDYTAAKCGAEIALFTGDVGVCEELSFLSKYDCYEEVAKQTEDPSICAEITTSGKKDDCYSAMAAELEDPSICLEISSGNDMDDCIYNYIYDYASWGGYYMDDWSICDEFSAPKWEQSYCYQEAAEDTGDLTYCDKITVEGGYYYSYSKSSCYATVAKDKSNPSLCAKLSDMEDRDDCYYSYAVTYPYKEEVCDNIVDTNLKEDCVYMTGDSYYY